MRRTAPSARRARNHYGYTTGFAPAMTLGPGAWGGSITSDNVTPMHLLNIKRLGREVRPYRDPLRGGDNRGETRSTAGPEPPRLARRGEAIPPDALLTPSARDCAKTLGLQLP